MFKYLLYAYRYIKTFNLLTNRPQTILPDELIQWEDKDRKSLEAYFETKTGQRLSRILKNIEAKNNANSVTSVKNITYDAGVACGSRMMLAHLFSLSAYNPQPKEVDDYEALREEALSEELEEIMSQYIKQ